MQVQCDRKEEIKNSVDGSTALEKSALEFLSEVSSHSYYARKYTTCSVAHITDVFAYLYSFCIGLNFAPIGNYFIGFFLLESPILDNGLVQHSISSI